MKKITLLFAVVLVTCKLLAQSDWKIAGDKIVTPWAEKVDPAKPLQEYPRPQMVRNNWLNLNGFWQYNILPKAQETIPAFFAACKIVWGYCVMNA